MTVLVNKSDSLKMNKVLTFNNDCKECIQDWAWGIWDSKIQRIQVSECLGPKFFGLKINNGQEMAEIYIKNATGKHEYKKIFDNHDYKLVLQGENSLGVKFELKLHLKKIENVVLEQDVELVTPSNTITLKK